MKQLFILLLAATTLVGCKDKKKGLLDPTASVYINSALPTRAANDGTLTPLEVVKQSQLLQTATGQMGLDSRQDTINVRFIADPQWIITFEGALNTNLITERDIVFLSIDEEQMPKDTLAYIPNSDMDAAESAIRAAYDADNYPEVYRLLQEAFKFTPITGKQWRELKAKGEN